jgi:hypothetical protein
MPIYSESDLAVPAAVIIAAHEDAQSRENSGFINKIMRTLGR